MNNDDFLGKTSEVLNGLIDSIEKGIKDLQKEAGSVGSGVFRGTPFGTDFFKKAEQQAETKTEGPAPFRGEKGSIPASRIEYAGYITIICELPGCTKGDLKLDYSKDQLVIRATKKKPETDGRPTLFEDDRKYGTFERVFIVGKVDASTIKASFKDGLLTINCRRAEDNGVGISIE